MRKTISLIVCLVAILAIAAPAYAQSVTQDTYLGLAGAEQGGGGTASATGTSGSLPFTGMELGLIGLVGVALVGTGFVMWRASHLRDDTV